VDHDELVRILHEQVKPAVGCTEPVAVALAAATAYAQTGGEIEEIDIKVSLNIYKNGMRVGVPGTEGKGIPFAAALAVICGKPKLKLELFREVDEACENRARKLLDRRIIRIRTVKERDETAKDGDQFAIDVLVRTDRGTGECSIRYEHTNIVQIKQNGAVVFSEDQAGSEKKGSTGPENITLSLEEILQIAEEADLKKLRFLLEGVDMNLKISDAGRAERYSSGMGQELFGLMEIGRAHV
jgi:L-cysteine desulfidase